MPRILAALALAFALPVLPAAAQQSLPSPSDMTAAEREAFRAEVRAYLLEHPEVVAEVLDLLEARREAEGRKLDAALVAEHRKAIFNDPDDWVGGNPEGDVTVVEFFDYRCGYCKRAHPEVKTLLERDPGVRYVAKEFPVLGRDSVGASRIALAALELDPAKYGELNDALMSFEGRLTIPVAFQLAVDLGYDPDELKRHAESEEIGDVITGNHELAETLQIGGTPAFVIGDRIIRGYLPHEELAAEVAKVRSATN